MVIRFSLGTVSLSRAKRLASRSALIEDKPVMFAPGCATRKAEPTRYFPRIASLPGRRSEIPLVAIRLRLYLIINRFLQVFHTRVNWGTGQLLSHAWIGTAAPRQRFPFD